LLLAKFTPSLLVLAYAIDSVRLFALGLGFLFVSFLFGLFLRFGLMFNAHDFFRLSH
jgi:hypothetical protein